MDVVAFVASGRGWSHWCTAVTVLVLFFALPRVLSVLLCLFACFVFGLWFWWSFAFVSLSWSLEILAS